MPLENVSQIFSVPSTINLLVVSSSPFLLLLLLLALLFNLLPCAAHELFFPFLSFLSLVLASSSCGPFPGLLVHPH